MAAIFVIQQSMNSGQIVAVLAGASFAAGLNVYATLATLGLLARSGALQLPPTLHLVESWPVIVVALIMFVIEFFADKIPAFDLIWNGLHTFIRVPIAAMLAYGATAQMSPATQAIATVVGGSIAFAAHGGKTAVRAAVTPSPEPVSNIALSMGEDVTAVGLTWFATKHPYWGAVIVVVLLIATVLTIRWMARVLGRLYRRMFRRQESASSF
jgi:Domain of unknown function (DUF4126)